MFSHDEELVVKKKDNKKFRSEWRDKSPLPSDKKFCVRLNHFIRRNYFK